MSRPWVLWGVPAGAGLLLAAALVMNPESGVREVAPLKKRASVQLPVLERAVDPAPLKTAVPRDALAAVQVAGEPLRLQESSWPAFQERLGELSRLRARLGEEQYGAAVLEETGRFLGFDPSTLAAFDGVRRVVQADLERIQAEAGRDLAAHPVDLPDVELRRLQQESLDRTRAQRQQAVSRLEVFLDGRDNHQQFRGFLEPWVLEIARINP